MKEELQIGGVFFIGKLLRILGTLVYLLIDYITHQNEPKTNLKKTHKSPFEGMLADEILDTWDAQKERYKLFINAF